MKKGIECNSLRRADVHSEEIVYRFVNDDDLTPSEVTVRLGNIDPMTGEPITDVTFFREYQAMENRQVYSNLKAARRPWTNEEMESRRKMKQEIKAEFEAEYGYTPSESTAQYLLEERWPISFVGSYDACVNEDGDDFRDYLPAFSDPQAKKAFPGEESDIEIAIREVRETLPERKKEVLDMLLLRAAYGVARGQKFRGADLAEKWGVTHQLITQDRRYILKKLKKKLLELRDENNSD